MGKYHVVRVWKGVDDLGRQVMKAKLENGAVGSILYINGGSQATVFNLPVDEQSLGDAYDDYRYDEDHTKAIEMNKKSKMENKNLLKIKRISRNLYIIYRRIIFGTWGLGRWLFFASALGAGEAAVRYVESVIL